jgi:hypothetical protein
MPANEGLYIHVPPVQQVEPSVAWYPSSHVDEMKELLALLQKQHEDGILFGGVLADNAGAEHKKKCRINTVSVMFSSGEGAGYHVEQRATCPAGFGVLCIPGEDGAVPYFLKLQSHDELKEATYSVAEAQEYFFMPNTPAILSSQHKQGRHPEDKCRAIVRVGFDWYQKTDKRKRARGRGKRSQ